jgi:hypothetical protein
MGGFLVEDSIDMPEWEMIEDWSELVSVDAGSDTKQDGFEGNIVILRRVGVAALQRRINFYLRFIFIPSIILVLISYAGTKQVRKKSKRESRKAQ